MDSQYQLQCSPGPSTGPGCFSQAEELKEHCQAVRVTTKSPALLPPAGAGSRLTVEQVSAVAEAVKGAVVGGIGTLVEVVGYTQLGGTVGPGLHRSSAAIMLQGRLAGCMACRAGPSLAAWHQSGWERGLLGSGNAWQVPNGPLLQAAPSTHSFRLAVC
jgi:hypothetical protein